MKEAETMDERNCYTCAYASFPVPITEGITQSIYSIEPRCADQEWEPSFDFDDPSLRHLGKVVPIGEAHLPCKQWRPRP